MPLFDHFHSPLKGRRHWEGFHSKWAGAIVDELDELLPAGYFAEPHVHLGVRVEADVGTFDERFGGAPRDASGGTLVWSPARPTVRAPMDAADFDAFEVRVFSDEGGPKLVAAIELVSPGNKDRESERNAFAVKCAAYLQQQVALIVVDIVTSRSGNLHDELLDITRIDTGAAVNPHELYAAAYRTTAEPAGAFLEVWLEPLAVGADLPTLPLWLSPDEAVPVDLERSYAATCRKLRIDID
jgi:hypothetical protein